MKMNDFIDILKESTAVDVIVDCSNIELGILKKIEFRPTTYGNEYCTVSVMDTEKNSFYRLNKPIHRSFVYLIDGISEIVGKGVVTKSACRLDANLIIQKSARNHARNSTRKTGVYVLKSACGEYVKIGVTADIKNRIRALQTSTPHKLELLCYFEGADYKFEAKLHKTFKKQRAQGEWFFSKITNKILKIHLEYKQTNTVFLEEI